MICKLEIPDNNVNFLEELKSFISKFDGVKMDINQDFYEDLKKSEEDLINGNVEIIDDIDLYIENLKNEIS
jgi:hypothetical protein